MSVRASGLLWADATKGVCLWQLVDLSLGLPRDHHHPGVLLRASRFKCLPRALIVMDARF
jgi:hypothetical protein